MLEYDMLLGAWLDDNGVYDGIVEVDVDTGEATKVEQPTTHTELSVTEQQVFEIEKSISSLKDQLKEAEQKQKILHEQLLKGMQENSIEQIQVGNIIIIRKPESVQRRLDTKKLEKDLPDIANQYKKDVKVGEHIEIRIKK